tara:strand:- start:324 stop:536 length:213 start_codon:yes stop_codon:yes gene_type:complete
MLLSQITNRSAVIPTVALFTLISVFIVGLFVVGFDQGHIFSMINGESAFVDQFLHELTHDMRHTAGFPCH